MANQASPRAKTSVSTWPASERSARECETTPPANSMARMTQVSASALFRVAPWSVIRSMNSSYPPAKALNGLTPPIFSSLQIGKKHPVAEPFVADLEHRQPVPVQEEQHCLDPGSERLDAVRRQPDVARHFIRPAGVEPAFAGQEGGGGPDAGRAAPGKPQRGVGGSGPPGDEALNTTLPIPPELSPNLLSPP